MASDNKDGEKDAQKSSLTANTNSSSTLLDQYDPDKNPIKYMGPDGKLSEEAHDKDYMELTLKSGKHSELVQRLLRQRIEMRAKEFPRWPGESSGGVRTMWIESRFWYDRERLGPDFDQDWREYRAKYIHSLALDPREPVHVPEYEKELINPIRRFYMIGGDWLENNIISKFAKDKMHSAMYRVVFTRAIMLYFASVGVYYWMRFNYRKWETHPGPRLTVTRPIRYPWHPKYPFKDFKTEPGHHGDQNFNRRKVFKDLREFEDNTVVL